MNLFRFLIFPFFLMGLCVSARAEFLIGIAHISGLTGPNLEWAGERTSYYVVPALESKRTGLGEDEVRWVVGLRHRLERGLTSTSGFYSGLTAGDLGGEDDYNRWGAGGELGYQWIKEYSRITLSSGVVVLEAVEEEELKEEPQLIIGITFSLRK